MKKLLLITFCVVFAKTFFAQTIVSVPLSENYIGCLGHTITVGFEPNTAIIYNWWLTETGTATSDLVANNQNSINVFISPIGMFPFVNEGDSQTLWVDVYINGVLQPDRISVTIIRGNNCGTTNPTGCYASGKILFKEDFGGNAPGDPNVGTPLLSGITTYTWAPLLNGNAVYMIGKETPCATHPTWYCINDHTHAGDPTRGYLFATDAAMEAGIFYERRISNLCVSTRVSFSAWIVSMINDLYHTAKANLVFTVEDFVTGKHLAQFYTGKIPDQSPVWKNYGFTFIPTSTDIILKIKNNNTAGTMGNDFCLDDIEIRLCLPSITTQNNNFKICSGSDFSLIPDFDNYELDIYGSFEEPLQYQWYFSSSGNPNNPADWTPLSDQTDLTLNIAPATSSDIGYYRLAITGANGDIENETCRAISEPIYLGMGTRTDIEEQICGSEPYFFCGEYITETGVYDCPDDDDCDGVTVLTITFSDGISHIYDTICEGKTYYFEGEYLTEGNTYSSDTIQNADGCDIATILHLTVLEAPVTEFYDTICEGNGLTYYCTNCPNFSNLPAGNYVFSDTTQTTFGCDSIITLYLNVKPYIQDSIFAAICQDGQYNFYDKMLNSAGIYTDTISSAVGCDTIVTLTLTINNYILQPIYDTICQGEQYDFYNVMLDTTGIYIDTISATTVGCDTIVTLNLTVLESFTSTVSDTICSGGSYTLHGQTYTTGGIYTIPLKSKNGCDSIVILYLKEIDNVDVVISIQDPCADDNYLILNFTPKSQTSILPTNYSVTFDEKTFRSPQKGEITDNEIWLEMPDSIYPDHYSLTITLSDNTRNCDGVPTDIDFTVLYPDTIMKQKWNNVIALLNEYYNGGFEFKAYEWYHNGESMNKTDSYIYLGDGNSLEEGDRYSVLITRKDDSQIFSCEFKAHKPLKPTSKFPTLVQPNSAIRIEIRGKTAIARIWSVTGILVASERINYSGQTICAPSQQGMYLLEIISDNYLREISPIVVK